MLLAGPRRCRQLDRDFSCSHPLDDALSVRRGGRCRGSGVIPRLVVDRGGSAVIQQGQVFKLKATCADGEPLWAYRYRIAGRGSARRRVGGLSSRAEAQRALQNKLARLLPGGRAAALTLGEWVEEYLDAHQGERVTVAKLRWLLGKAIAELGEVRLAELSPAQVCDTQAPGAALSYQRWRSRFSCA